MKSDQQRPRGCHSGACSAFYRASYGVSAFSRRFHGAHNECRLSFLRWRRVEDAVASQRAPYNLLANAKVNAPVEPLLRCRRPIAQIWRPYGKPLGRATAPSFGVLCDPTASTGYATALLRWFAIVLRAARLSTFFLDAVGSPWERCALLCLLGSFHYFCRLRVIKKVARVPANCFGQEQVRSFVGPDLGQNGLPMV